MTQYAVNQQN